MKTYLNPDAIADDSIEFKHLTENAQDIIESKEDRNNKSTVVNENSTDVQYASSKSVYTIVHNLEVDINNKLGDVESLMEFCLSGEEVE